MRSRLFGSISCLPPIKESLKEFRSLLAVLLCPDSQENLADLRDASGFAISDLLEFSLKVSRNAESERSQPLSVVAAEEHWYLR